MTSSGVSQRDRLGMQARISSCTLSIVEASFFSDAPRHMFSTVEASFLSDDSRRRTFSLANAVDLDAPTSPSSGMSSMAEFLQGFDELSAKNLVQRSIATHSFCTLSVHISSKLRIPAFHRALVDIVG